MCFLVYILLGLLGTCGHPTFGFIGFLKWLAEKVNLVVFVSRTHTHTQVYSLQSKTFGENGISTLFPEFIWKEKVTSLSGDWTNCGLKIVDNYMHCLFCHTIKNVILFLHFLLWIVLSWHKASDLLWVSGAGHFSISHGQLSQRSAEKYDLLVLFQCLTKDTVQGHNLP